MQSENTNTKHMQQHNINREAGEDKQKNTKNQKQDECQQNDQTAISGHMIIQVIWNIN